MMTKLAYLSTIGVSKRRKGSVSTIEPAIAYGQIVDAETNVVILNFTDSVLAFADVRDATSTAIFVPNISSIVDPALAVSDVRDATSTATPVPNISSVVDPALANSDIRDISSVSAIPQPLDQVAAFADIRDVSTTQLLSGYIRRWNANVGVTTGATFTWADEFGNNATQSTAGFQPTTTTVGGKNAIAFDGNDDILVTNTATYAAKTIIIVFKLDRTFSDYDGLISMRTSATKCATSNEDIICVGYPQDGGTTKLNGSTDNASDIVYVNGLSDSRSNFNNFTPGGGGVPTGGFGTSAMQCIAFTRNNSSSGSKTFTIGAECILNRWLQGKISEIIIYDTVLTDAQLAKNYINYIQPTWGTPVLSSIKQGLIGHWRLEESSGTLYDSFGTNHLTTLSGITYSQTGKVGDTVDFNGVSSYARCASNDMLQTGDVDFAVACWVKFDTLTTYRMFVSKDGLSGTREWNLLYDPDNANKITFSVFKATNSIVQVPSVVPSTGTWYYVFAWHDSAADTIYIQVNDGTIYSQATGGALQSPGSRALTIGSWDDASTAVLHDGLVDEVSFWKGRIPSSGERTYLYNSGSGRSFLDWY